MYKIFFEDRFIQLTDNIEIIKKPAILDYSYENKNKLDTIISDFDKNRNIRELSIYHDNVEELLTHFSDRFIVMDAAGGVVKNPENELLIIFRFGRWDLPKGKVEEGESYVQAALREVKEECGINELKLIKHLKTTYHTYHIKKQTILKRTFWYTMENSGKEPLFPQKEEHIEQAKWANKTEVSQIIGNTYESLKELFISAL